MRKGDTLITMGNLQQQEPMLLNLPNDLTTQEAVFIQNCVSSFCSYAEGHFNEEIMNTTTNASGLNCGEVISKLLCRLSHCIQTCDGDYKLIIQRLQDFLDLATEKFYAFPFKDVPVFWRDLFRKASLLKFTTIALKKCWGSKDAFKKYQEDTLLDDDQLDGMIRVMDMALIMVGQPHSPDFVGPSMEAMLEMLENLSLERVQGTNEHYRSAKRQKLDTDDSSLEDCFPSIKIPSFPTGKAPLSMDNPAFDVFEKCINEPSDSSIGPEPILLQNVLDFWPARNERPWNRPSYLLSKTIGGRRLVPVELGRSYVDADWGQKIITFREFMNQYILDPPSHGKGTGYLAQHNLFAQIPALRKDISVPDYCYVSPPPPHHSSPLVGKHSAIPKLEEPLLNAWFGPASTISPLHTDPYHNILAQVVGCKYVRLYAPRESAKLYARGVEGGGVDMQNTSAVDVGILAGYDGTKEEMDDAHRQFPLFKDALFIDCVLNEGECLYIPVGWWHYVRSLSVSFSVSFWFN